MMHADDTIEPSRQPLIATTNRFSGRLTGGASAARYWAIGADLF
jgi:hypothetical protein